LGHFQFTQEDATFAWKKKSNKFINQNTKICLTIKKCKHLQKQLPSIQKDFAIHANKKGLCYY
jgi:hypothetical protein